VFLATEKEWVFEILFGVLLMVSLGILVEGLVIWNEF
jgi:hypothetical protein